MSRLDLSEKSLPPDLRRLLTEADQAVAVQDRSTALRLLDRAWRRYPSHQTRVAPCYAAQLLAEGSDPRAAFDMSERAVALAPSTNTTAVLIRSLLALNDLDSAHAQFAIAVNRHAIAYTDELALIATDLLSTQHPGWIGMRTDLCLIGAQLFSEPPVTVMIDGVTLNRDRIVFDADGPYRTFSVQLQADEWSKAFTAHSQHRPLLGSGLRIPSDFGLESVTQEEGHSIRGWVKFNWAPNYPITLHITDEHGFRYTHRLSANTDTQPHSFIIHRAKTGLKGHRWQITVDSPAQSVCLLPGSPFLWPVAAKEGLTPPHTRAPKRTPRAPSTIDVIVPVYDGLEETMACLRSVLATLPKHARLIVIDDATPNDALARHLDELAASHAIKLIRHPTNRGFVASVNAGLQLNPSHDAVLLNADTQVFGDWLSRLQKAAYSDASIGTVTPWSNQGSIASYPGVSDPTVTPHDAERLDALAAQTLTEQRVMIPVGVGFCLYIRRDCLEATGLLNEAVFGRGYGEETDFCMRARARGYRHLLAADVYVYHIGSRSFGRKREALLARSQRLVNLRHPGYDQSIQQFEAKDPIAPYRRQLDEKRIALDPRPAVLLISHALQGGVERVVQTRTTALQAEGFQVLILRPATAGNRRQVRLSVAGLQATDLLYQLPLEMARLLKLLKLRRLDHLEVHHFLHLDPQLMDALLALKTPVDVQIHDYAWVCPQITLIDHSGRYCKEKGLTACQSCVKKIGTEIGERLSVPALRQRSARWLARARQIRVPTHDTQTRFQTYFPSLSFQVEALGVTPTPAPEASHTRRSHVRVAVIGAIGAHKGYDILLRCARDAAKRRLPLEFVVVGFTQGDVALERTGRVFMTGRYQEGEALPLLRREDPDLVFLPSVWPETWCYTLDPAIESGLPVAAFDIGAIRERLHGQPQGYLLPLELSAALINDALLARVRPPAHLPRALHARYPLSTAIDIPTMPMPTDANGLSASVQLLPLPEGLYVISVESGNPRTHQAGGTLTLPAIHVSTGPGMAVGDAEFLAKESGLGGWLFAPGDFLVVRLKTAQSSLLITSIRDAAGALLTIKVERLDSRFDERVATSHTATPLRALPTTPIVRGGVNLQISAHVRNHGDLVFERAPWAGRVGPGLWLESFAITPLDDLIASDIEYKGLTSSGFETPWISGGKACGTKQLGVPLVGFAVRLKASAKTAAYECTYSGYFQSGAQVGPLHNGAPCRSTVANDPLEGIQLQIIQRAPKKASIPPKRPVSAPAKKTSKDPTSATKKKAR